MSRRPSHRKANWYKTVMQQRRWFESLPADCRKGPRLVGAILKHLYPQGKMELGYMVQSWAYRLALKHRWITKAQFDAAPRTEPNTFVPLSLRQRADKPVETAY